MGGRAIATYVVSRQYAETVVTSYVVFAYIPERAKNPDFSPFYAFFRSCFSASALLSAHHDAVGASY